MKPVNHWVKAFMKDNYFDDNVKMVKYLCQFVTEIQNDAGSLPQPLDYGNMKTVENWIGDLNYHRFYGVPIRSLYFAIWNIQQDAIAAQKVANKIHFNFKVKSKDNNPAVNNQNHL